MGSFNPRLTSAARRTSESMLRWPNMDMFQSTPHLSGKANARLDQGSAGNCGFQSTPHLSGKANGDWIRPSGPFKCFNPRLTSEARRTATKRQEGLDNRVSIHASPQRKGEQR